MVGIMNLMKNTFNLGYCRCTDETKVELLIALKAFIVVFIVFHYYGFNTLFDVNLEKAHEGVINRINDVMMIFESKLSLPHDFTYSILGSMAFILSLSLVRINIKFAYYFYVMTKN